MSGSERDLTPLEAAMASSFEYSPNIAEKKSDAAAAAPAAPPAVESVSVDEPAGATESEPSSEENWKAEYDERLAEWRATAAVSREKAEQERARWAAVRAEEAKQGVSRPPLPDAPAPTAQSNAAELSGSLSMHGWETVGASTMVSSVSSSARGVSVPTRQSPSPADVRDLVSGEHPGGHGLEVLQEVLGPRPSAPARVSTAEAVRAIDEHLITTDEDSGKSASHWENLPSLASSFPSLPSHPSPPSKPREADEKAVTSTPAPKDRPARSITLLLFDSSTTTRIRLLALAATLGINFLLPFINGVMIGFGEIAAKGMVNWWRTGRGLSATAAGMRTAHPIV
ncbi:hypothetical protein BKA62DRAFT_680567 [Auriculariales sp. MPI-PUGE-AT-0066]|nr:hypothetical protein BKA62DRAFT_680567 [Auriculariales sp. MPI-PUGE-AT-0066]